MATLSEPRHGAQTSIAEAAAPTALVAATDTSGRSTSTLTHRLLAALGLPVGVIIAAILAADRRDDGSDAATILMENGSLDPAAWWPALAGALGLGYRAAITPIADARHTRPGAGLDRDAQQIWIADTSDDRAAPTLAIAPRGGATARISLFLAENPALRARVVVVSAETLRAALRRQLGAALTDTAVRGLSRAWPLMSAARPPAMRTVQLCGAVLAVSPFAVVLTDFGVGLALLALFLPLTLLRLMAVLEPIRPSAAPPLDEAELPRYAVLVPLYHEAAMVPDLARALAALDYPRDKLDLKLLVEADDAPTRTAAMEHARHAGWDVVVVPPSLPRTKPKALAFGLQLVDADLVTVYDAEDRPAPDQLRRAAAAFAQAPADVACLQAALVIDRPAGGAGGWLAQQFALEYRIQFQALLPWFAARCGWFLLGGTSNHFRHAALVGVGGWDPYNVTEDADIAVRLRRAGWRLDMLASATREEAPPTRAIWTVQRSRWLKGWMQTWLVHMRRPAQLARDLGPGGFALFHLLLGGQIVSAFVFPASAIAVLLLVSGLSPLVQERSFLGDVGLMTALVTCALAWINALVLALQTTPARRWPMALVQAATLPVYWLLLYPAVIAAILELATAPFRWNKTPHGEASGRVPPSKAEPRGVAVPPGSSQA